VFKFKEFLKEVFPYNSPFDRKDLGFLTNLIKYFSLRIAYILYRIGITANLLNIFGLFLTALGFITIFYSLSEINLIMFLFGYSLIAITIFIDFVDGPLSKANKYIYVVGDSMDNLGPDMILIGGMLILGFISGNSNFFILMTMNSIFYLTFTPVTLDSVKRDKNKWLVILYRSRYSLFSMRVFCAGIFPSMCILYIINPVAGVLISKLLILFYTLMSFGWIKISLNNKSLR
jgi:hypothetical protein